MCLDAQAMRSYAAAKGWETRRRRLRAKPFEEGGTNYMTAGGGAKEEGGTYERSESSLDAPEYEVTCGGATGSVAQ